MKLGRSVDYLNGVGASMQKRLDKLGISDVGDLLTHYPRRYDDFSKITKIADSEPGLVTFAGEITKVSTRRTRKGRSLTEALIVDDSGSVQAIWFNQPYLAKQLPRNKPVYVAGELAYKYSRYALQNPVVEPVSSFPQNTARIVPVYPETHGLTSKQLRRLIKQVLRLEVPEYVPVEIRQKYQVLDKHRALKGIHFPDNTAEMEAARYSLAFEELYILMLLASELKQEVAGLKAPKIAFDQEATRSVIEALDFDLTDDQRKAAWKILQDLDSEKPMNRLLQGDVGSGKTVVAALAALQTARNGMQTALLAPTEILARQHYATLTDMLAGQDIETVLLTSALGEDERRQVQQKISTGEAEIVVGTHALLRPEINFHNIGLAIIDEQHRFGVKQRQQLRDSGREGVHVLSMSATPIPRSLALTVYGDLDISNIRQLPEGRKSPITRVVYGNENVYEKIYELIEKGEKAFVVCPLIEESEALDASSVEEEVRKLRRLWPQAVVEGLHGRMRSEEKADIMNKFHKGSIDALVSTTVVEVGVDVADANVMLIEGAERFGLATLHQLRGRIGRGGSQSYCFIRTATQGQARKRLDLMERYSDGFKLAEQDLQLRGAGEIHGVKQHGLMDLRLAKLDDRDLINRVKKAVEDTGELSEQPQLQAVIADLRPRTDSQA